MLSVASNRDRGDCATSKQCNIEKSRANQWWPTSKQVKTFGNLLTAENIHQQALIIHAVAMTFPLTSFKPYFLSKETPLIVSGYAKSNIKVQSYGKAYTSCMFN